MKKDELLKYVESQGDKDFVIRTAEEEVNFLANHAKEVEEKLIPEKISKLHSQYDDDVYSVTGLRKAATEKTYDFVKRVLSSLKTDAEKAKSLESEMATLKDQIAKGKGNEQVLADLEAVRKQYNELKESKEQEITKLRTEQDKFRAETQIRAAIPVNIKKGLPEDAVKALTEQAVSHLISIAQLQDGKLVFVENGVIKRNPHNKLEPYTAQELLSEQLKNIIDTGRKLPGGPDLNSEVTYEKDKNGKITKVAMIVPDSVRTKEDLSKYLVSAGLLRGTQEYMAAYSQYSNALPMR